MIRTWSVQKAVYSALAADSAFMASITGLVDEPEQNQGYPYVLIGEGTATPEDLLVETGAQQTITLHFWDRDAPISRIKQIMDRAVLLLHRARFIIGESQLVDCSVEFVDVNRDVDTLHGVMRVRVITFG